MENKAKPNAITEIRAKYFPGQRADRMMQLFDFPDQHFELDEAGKERIDLILGAISRGLYEEWAEMQIENLIESL